MRKYAEAFEKLQSQFLEVQVLQIRRGENAKANELARLASSLTKWASQDPIYVELPAASTILSVEEGNTEREMTPN